MNDTHAWEVLGRRIAAVYQCQKCTDRERGFFLDLLFENWQAEFGYHFQGTDQHPSDILKQLNIFPPDPGP